MWCTKLHQSLCFFCLFASYLCILFFSFVVLVFCFLLLLEQRIRFLPFSFSTSALLFFVFVLSSLLQHDNKISEPIFFTKHTKKGEKESNCFIVVSFLNFGEYFYHFVLLLSNKSAQILSKKQQQQRRTPKENRQKGKTFENGCPWIMVTAPPIRSRVCQSR